MKKTVKKKSCKKKLKIKLKKKVEKKFKKVKKRWKKRWKKVGKKSWKKGEKNWEKKVFATTRTQYNCVWRFVVIGRIKKLRKVLTILVKKTAILLWGDYQFGWFAKGVARANQPSVWTIWKTARSSRKTMNAFTATTPMAMTMARVPVPIPRGLKKHVVKQTISF